MPFWCRDFFAELSANQVLTLESVPTFTDAAHFRPGALVTSALAKYSRSVASSVPNSSAIRNAFPAHPGCDAFWYAPHLQRLPQLSSECITVPEICLSPTCCPINIVSPFNQVAAQQGHFSSSMPHNQGHISVKSGANHCFLFMTWP